MFKNLNRRISYFSMPVGDEGGTPSENTPEAGGDTNALGGTIPQPTQENPAWAGYVEKFPTELMPLAKETFAEWDKNVQQKFQSIHEQYKPFKPFLDQKVDPGELDAAWKIAGILKQDPTGFAKLLAEQVGLTFTEAQQVTQELQNQQQDPDEAEEVDPALAGLQQQVQQLTQFIAQQQQQEQQAQIQAEVDADLNNQFAALEDKYGKLDQVIKNQVLREALRLSVETDQPVTMEQAYSNLEQFVSQVRQVPRPGQFAPQVLPKGGGMPLSPAPKNPGEMSSSERKQQAAAVAARLIAQGS